MLLIIYGPFNIKKFNLLHTVGCFDIILTINFILHYFPRNCELILIYHMMVWGRNLSEIDMWMKNDCINKVLLSHSVVFGRHTHDSQIVLFTTETCTCPVYHLLEAGLQQRLITLCCVQEDAQPMQETDPGEIVESGGCYSFFSEMV